VDELVEVGLGEHAPRLHLAAADVDAGQVACPNVCEERLD
jgi:hypothetical protein